jgi:hypothetical protein
MTSILGFPCEVYRSHRRTLIRWVFEFSEYWSYSRDTSHRAIHYFDQYVNCLRLQPPSNIPSSELLLWMMACL